jgi:hypothetical protein
VIFNTKSVAKNNATSANKTPKRLILLVAMSGIEPPTSGL